METSSSAAGADGASVRDVNAVDPGETARQRLVAGVFFVVGVVLRWWDLGGPRLTFDEAFTAAYARLPAADLFTALRDNDSHPPLDYLVRQQLADHGAFWLRAPSALISCLTLVVVAWWMRARGWFGVAVVGFTSLSAFQLLYAHQARMYALSIFAGTVCAVAADRWRAPDDRRVLWSVFVGVAVAVGLLSHSMFGVYVPFLVLVAGFSTTRAAWVWRGAIVAGGVAWAVVWGPSFAIQIRQENAGWIPYTSIAGVRDAISGFVTLSVALGTLATILVVVGVFALWRVERQLGWLVVLLAALPFAVVVCVGIWKHVLLTRALAFAAWAVPLALAALVEAARRRSSMWGLAVAGCVVALLVPSVGSVVSFEEDGSEARQALTALVRPGDAVVVNPGWLWPIAAWDEDLPPGFDPPFPSAPTPLVPVDLAGLDAYVAVVGGEPFSGRVWAYLAENYGFERGPLVACDDQPPAFDGEYAVQCFEVAGRQ